jgi:hypothetical protein
MADMYIVIRRSVYAALGGVVLVGLLGAPALGHGGGIDAVVEVASIDGGFEYGLRLEWSDGDPISGAHVVMSAVQGDLVEVTEPAEVVPGEYVGTLLLGSNGEWQVSVEIHRPDSNGRIDFVQTVSANDLGSWVVLVDTSDGDRVGATPDAATSILDPPPQPSSTSTAPTTVAPSSGSDSSSVTTPTTTTPTVPAEPTPVEARDVVVDIAAGGQGPEVDIGMRIVHLVAIALWIVPVVASLVGKQSTTSVVLAVAGVNLTLVSGVVLMHWGTPISYPGLFNWSEIADLSYGSQYLTAFAAKLIAVLIAAFATVRWAIAADRKAAWATLGLVTVAVLAVTAMSQFHLLSHV